jgi:hypothetical protein
MRKGSRGLALACVILTAALLLAGCGLASSSRSPTSEQQSPRTPTSPGEKVGTAPAEKQAVPVSPAPSPRAAVERFAEGYINWSYATVAADQQRLAASAVGEARANELQARQQTERDTALTRGRVFNSGIVVVAALVNGSTDVFACVTREQTGGEGEYAALAAAYHVALGTVQRVPGGWAVSAWRPEL